MIFSSLPFFIFFFIIILLLLFLKDQRSKKIVLLLSSYFFYSYWDYRFLTLILVSTLVDYYIGKKLVITNKEKERKRLLIISLVVNLGILGFFKYFNFFIDSANSAFGFLGLNLSTLNIILPVGISFYTFQTLSYTIDIFRKKIEPAKSLLDFSIFVAFFPQLVAGPIVRASEFLPQLKKDIQIRKDNVLVGLQIFIFGLIKKVIIADRIAYFVDDIFMGPDLYGTATIWLAVIAYSIQIYCDFSGYSDMAIGIGRMMGFKLPVNFRMPYISRNVTEFWRRWHISLSTWLRDYLYIPLGGNRKGKTRTYINLMITMLLGGLWHGASWNFVFWGFLHGLGLMLNKLLHKGKQAKHNYFTSFFSWLMTYIFVCITWVFFRSHSFGDSMIILSKMFSMSDGIVWLYIPVILIIPLVVFSHAWAIVKRTEGYIIMNLATLQGAFALIFILMALFYFRVTNSNPFIYFQF
ncbi:MBOAT family O-acyltransferase [Patescibacteria group bacterium]